MTPTETSQLIAQYTSEAAIYERMGTAVSHLISQILSSEGLTAHSVTHRRKTTESLENKLKKPDKHYQSLNEITDLSGIRITTYFSGDVDLIAKLIEREFAIDHQNSVDKRIALDPDRFGYQSLHYVAQLDKTRSALVEYKIFSGKKFEIQIRSILQHAWAEIEHDLGYKSAIGVPKEIRRRFARVAGLLEIADDEFVSLRSELRHYEEEVGKNIELNPDDVDLDIPSLKSIYSNKSATSSLDIDISKNTGIKLVEADSDYFERTLKRLLYLGINRVSDLEKHAKDNHGLVVKLANKIIKKGKYENISKGIGVFYLTYILISAKKDKKEFIEYLDKFSIGTKSDREETFNRITSSIEEIQGTTKSTKTAAPNKKQ